MNSSSPITDRPSTTLQHLTLMVLLFGAIVVVRWLILATFGNDAPYWDQWEGEVALLYKPYVDGTLPFAQMVEPHNEHRIFFSRAFNLLLFEANDRQFDNLVETYANAVVYSIALLAAAWPVLRRLSGANLLIGAIVVACAGIAPYGAENLLVGFQNAFYFLILFAAIGMAAIASGNGAGA
ncbi:MAG TPA: hypothetical protein VJ724_11935, partial [Tahibacter sp.]|nr:hypothetical protein [Tahibacter sp.]